MTKRAGGSRAVARLADFAALLFLTVSLLVVTVCTVLYASLHDRQPARAHAVASPAVSTSHYQEPQSISISTPHLGFFQDGITASYQPAERFAQAVGHRPDILLYYNLWGKPFSLAFAARAAAHGAVPFVQMEPRTVTMASIAAGDSDAYLRGYAQLVRSFGRPVILSFAPEMNGNWYPWGWTHTSPQVWVAAWRHVVTVFREQGAANVTWLWTISHDISGFGPIRDYWPGARYVDWVGVDGYYLLPSDQFASVFGQQLQNVRKITKTTPIFLSEVGIGQLAGQAAKIPGLFAGIRQYHLLGLLWFDVHQHNGLHHQDWQLEGHPAAVAAFRQGLASLGL